MTTSQDVVNEALSLIGYDGAPVSAPAPNFDSSAPGQIAMRTYPYAVQAMARMYGWSFARTTAILSLTGNAAPFPWKYEYSFPSNCVDVWQLAPQGISDINNPTPMSWARGVDVVAGAQVSVILANLQNAMAIFNGNPTESTWDALFRAAVVRYLASEFAVANLGKPDLAAAYVDGWKDMSSIGMRRTDQ